MVDSWKISELEHEYYARKRAFDRAEELLEDYHYQFRSRTDFLIEQVYEAYQDSDILQDRNHFIYRLQDGMEEYHRDYLSNRELLEESRYQERLAFEKQMEEWSSY